MALAKAQQVHQKEREIIEHIAGAEALAELDGIEQNRPVVDKDDIAAVKIAVAAAHRSRFGARGKERLGKTEPLAIDAAECSVFSFPKREASELKAVNS
jgi:hypothetical protein